MKTTGTSDTCIDRSICWLLRSGSTILRSQPTSLRNFGNRHQVCTWYEPTHPHVLVAGSFNIHLEISIDLLRWKPSWWYAQKLLERDHPLKWDEMSFAEVRTGFEHSAPTWTWTTPSLGAAWGWKWLMAEENTVRQVIKFLQSATCCIILLLVFLFLILCQVKTC